MQFMSKLSLSISQSVLNLYRFIFARPELYRFNLHLYKLALRGLGVLNSEGSAATGETHLFTWLQQQRVSLNTVFDVGANTGTYTQELLEYFPKAQVVCFEPNPHTFELLQKSLSQTTATLKQLAVGDVVGTQQLWDFAPTAPLKSTQPNSTLASLHKSVVEELHHQPAAAVAVHTTTLDAFCARNHHKRIDLLKIDTEGNELAVLQGAQRLIAQNKLGIAQLEFNEMHAFSRVFFRDIMHALPDHEWFRLLPNGLLPLGEYRPLTHEIFGFQNVVAIPKKVLAKLHAR